MNILGKPLFYTPSLSGVEIILSEDESRHCVASLRYQLGDHIFITNGHGKVAKAEILKSHPKACVVRIIETEERDKLRLFRRLVVSPPKAGERLDWLLEKTIEIGVDEVVFVETHNSERDKVNMDRACKIAVATIKQSKQTFLPNLRGILKWERFLEEAIAGEKYIAHVEETTNPLWQKKLTMATKSVSPVEITVLIGPEGDFSSNEIEQAKQRGYEPVSLGQNVLRTETACLYALTIINAFV